MIETLIIGIVALAILKGRKASGVGSVLYGEKRKPRRKRTIFMELSDAQKEGINFNEPYNPQQSDILNRLAERYNFNKALTTRKDGSWYDNAEQYFDTLRRTYKAISGIGATNLPYSESEIRNANGDVIITYRDYGTPEQQLQDAYTMIEEMLITDADSAYWHTLLYIAQGGKLVWKTKKSKGGELISRGVDDILNHADRERKARISYLGSAGNGAMTLDRLTHHLWESSDGYSRDTDDGEIYNGVEQAVLSCQSRKQAQQEILDLYLSNHQIPEEDPNAIFDELQQHNEVEAITNRIEDICYYAIKNDEEDTAGELVWQELARTDPDLVQRWWSWYNDGYNAPFSHEEIVNEFSDLGDFDTLAYERKNRSMPSENDMPF